jgi:hypothetical protein
VRRDREHRERGVGAARRRVADRDRPAARALADTDHREARGQAVELDRIEPFHVDHARGGDLRERLRRVDRRGAPSPILGIVAASSPESASHDLLRAQPRPRDRKCFSN